MACRFRALVVLYWRLSASTWCEKSNVWATVSAWASYQIRKIAGCACTGNAGERFLCHRLQRKPIVSDPSMHHGTCVTHVPWCMSGSLTRGGGKTFPAFSTDMRPAILRIWQEAHLSTPLSSIFLFTDFLLEKRIGLVTMDLLNIIFIH